MSAGPYILVVDDEPGIRDLLICELGARGYQVSAAANGQEALEKAKGQRFQVIISDVNMPKMNGIDALQALKALDPEVEIVMATGYGTVQMAVDAMKQGAYDFLQKPFNLDELFAVVDKALEKRELRSLLAVYEASQAVFSSVRLDALLPKIADIALRMLRADDVSILLGGEDGRFSTPTSAWRAGAQRRDKGAPSPQGVAARVARSKKPALIAGPLRDDPRFAGLPESEGVRCSIVCPLVAEGRVLGVLCVNRRAQEEPFADAHLRTAVILSSQTAQAVCNAQLYRELEQRMSELKEAYHQLEQAQLQLVESEKLAAIGQLAAGVAHELNNPLTGILGFAQMLLQNAGLSAQQREDLETIHQQSQRCRQIIQNLLQFSRRRESPKGPVEPARLLTDALRLVQYELSISNIQVAADLPEGLPAVYGDASQLQQVFLNILTNARQALEDRKDGTLSVSARAEDGLVVFRFADNGNGIAREHLGRIFDPFFTTKPVGKGTGLGLSISYGIVKAHHGKISVESREGEGSTFVVELPTCPPSANHEQPASASEAAS